MAHFVDLIPEGSSVLDVGCGDGLMDVLIAKRRPDLRVAGVDVLVRRDARIAVTPFDGTRLPFSNESWDTVILCDVLHHTTDPVPLLREAARVARHHVLIKDHTVDGAFARSTLRLMDIAGNIPHGVRLTYKYLTADEWKEVICRSGLELETITRDLELYPRWADWLFGRSLHFLAVYSIRARPVG